MRLGAKTGAAQKPSGSEAGYAMLLLFAMAAIMAIMLYNALPRIAFEAQRDQEELLIERGEQYKRAIQLYYRKTKRYPAKLEDLDNTNGMRFLRHKYVDPMNGKSEWRIIHIGPGGRLTDSLIKKKDPNKKEESVNNFITELQPIGGGPQQPVVPNANSRRRASEGQASSPGDPSGLNNGVANSGAAPLPGMPLQPGQYAPGAYGQAQNGQFSPGQPYPGQPYPNQTDPNQVLAGAQPFTGGIAGMNTAQPGLPVNSQTGGVSPTPYSPYSTQPGAQGTGAPPFPSPSSQTAAADVIRNLLTTPRPGGLPGAAGGTLGGTQISGGIAGVASTVERGGIKIYNEQDEYNKWEFVYDFSKDKLNGPVAGVATPSANQPGLNGPGLNGPAVGQSATSTAAPTPPNPIQGPNGAFPPGVQQGIFPQPGFPPPQTNVPGNNQPQPNYPPGFVPPGSQPPQPNPQPGDPQQTNPQQTNPQQPIFPPLPGNAPGNVPGANPIPPTP